MNPGSSFRLVSAAIGIIAVAWLFAANHCALVAVQKSETPPAEHASCHSEQRNSAPIDHSNSCCEALAAPLPPLLAAPAIHLKELKLAWFPAPRTEASPEAPILVVGYAAQTGPPPNSLSFALLVLNRSLLSHAPPRLAA